MYLYRSVSFLCLALISGCATTPSQKETVYTAGNNKKVDSHIRDGINYYDQLNYSAAIEQYKSALSLDSSHPIALYELSLAYMSSNKNDECVATAKSGLGNTTDLDDKFNGLIATCYSQSGKIRQAISTFKSALKSSPDNFELHYNLAVAYSKANEDKQAIRHLKETIKIKPDYASPYLVLGELYRRNNRTVPAMFFFMQFGLLEQNTARTKIAAKNIFNFSSETYGADKNQISVNLESAEGAEHFLTLDIALQFFAMDSAAEKEQNPARYHVSVLIDLLDLSDDIQKNNPEMTSTFIWQYAGKDILALHTKGEFKAYAYGMAGKAGIPSMSERLAAFIR